MIARVEPVLPRPPRLLWANLYCLLDSSRGASMSVRAMLCSLARQGAQVQVLGATVFDHASGGADSARLIAPAQRRPGQQVQLGVGPVPQEALHSAAALRAPDAFGGSDRGAGAATAQGRPLRQARRYRPSCNDLTRTI